jgi:hypothetical protein
MEALSAHVIAQEPVGCDNTTGVERLLGRCAVQHRLAGHYCCSIVGSQVLGYSKAACEEACGASDPSERHAMHSSKGAARKEAASSCFAFPGTLHL